MELRSSGRTVIALNIFPGPIIFWGDRVSHRIWSSKIKLGQLAGESQGVTCLCFLRAKIIQALTWVLGIFPWVQAIYHWTIFPACIQRKLSPGAGTWVRSVRTSMALSGIVKGVGWSEVLHTKGEVVSAQKKKKPWKPKGEQCAQNGTQLWTSDSWHSGEGKTNVFPTRQHLPWSGFHLLSGSAQRPLGSSRSRTSGPCLPPPPPHRPNPTLLHGPVQKIRPSETLQESFASHDLMKPPG